MVRRNYARRQVYGDVKRFKGVSQWQFEETIPNDLVVAYVGIYLRLSFACEMH